MRLLNRIGSLAIGIVLLVLPGLVEAQTDTLKRSAFSSGGKWLSRLGYSSAVMVGQGAASGKLTGTDTLWTGSVGFFTPKPVVEINNAPFGVQLNYSVSITSGAQFDLFGDDIDDDPIQIDIVDQPSNGVMASSGSDFGFVFNASAGLQPDQVYRDTMQYLVQEKEGGLSSVIYDFYFQFSLEDTTHFITNSSFDPSSGDLSVEWEDPVVNSSYAIIWSYYDLTDIASPEFKTIVDQSYGLDELTVNGTVLNSVVSVSQDDHPYVYSADKVFMIASVATTGGYYASSSFVLDNTSGGRLQASEDGEFFTFGGNLSVRENRSVAVQLQAVELGDFDLTSSTIQLLTQPQNGSITSLVLQKSSTNHMVWNTIYSATQEEGGLDSIQFRIYHPERKLYDTAWAHLTIQEVNDPPVFISIADKTLEEDQVFTLNITAIDPDNDLEYIVQTSESSNLTTTYSSGLLTVTPAADFVANFTVTMIASEVGTSEGYVGYTQFDVEMIDVNDAPVVSTITDQSIQEDQQLSIVLAATDVDAALPVFNFAATISDPVNFTLEIDGSQLNVIPAADVNGSFEVQVTADDQTGTATSLSEPVVFNLQIAAINDAPTVIREFATQSVIDGMTAYSIDLQNYFYDVESNDELVYTISTSSAVEVSISGSTLTVDSSPSLSGFEELQITASDGELSTSQTIVFVKLVASSDISVNDALSYQLDEDFGSYEVDLSDVFSDASNISAVFDYSIVGNNKVDYSVSENTLTFASKANINGNESLVLIATTGDKSAFTTISMDISSINDAPVIGTFQDLILVEDLYSEEKFIRATDVDSDNLTMSFFSEDASKMSADGSVLTAINGGFNVKLKSEANQNGEVAVGLVVSDGELTDTVMFNVNILAVNDRPVLSGAFEDKLEDVTFSISLDSLFSDVDGDVLTYDVTSLPEWMSWSAQTLSGTPTNSEVGSYSLSIQADDQNGGVLDTEVTFSVLNVNDAPYVSKELVELSLYEGFGSYSESLETYFVDEDGDDLSFEAVASNTEVLAVSIVGDQLVVDELTNGQASITVSAFDGNGGEVSASFSVVINNVNDAPVVVSVIGQVDLIAGFNSYQLAIDAYFEDPDGDVLVISASSSDEAVATVNVTNESLILTEKGVGTAEIEVVANDGNGGIVSTAFSIKVTAAEVLIEPVYQLKIYPNPAMTEVVISDKSGVIKQVEILDMLGRVTLEAHTNETIDVSGLAAGMYIVKCNKARFKLIKQ